MHLFSVMVSVVLALSALPPNAAPRPAWPGSPPPADAPGPRADAGVATDPAGQVMLFGGRVRNPQGAFDYLGDTWKWDGVAWTQMHPPVSPQPRAEMMIAYDAARGQVVVFGGMDGFGPSFDDTWTWDGTTWTEQHPPTLPPAECCSGMAYDAGTAQVVLFGSETWTWDGTTWTQEHPSRSPQPRSFPAMAGSRAHVVLFGGDVCLEICLYPHDTWSWDGTTWGRRRPSTRPEARGSAAMAYDMRSRVTVLFGGVNENMQHGLFDDTWVWDGTDWMKVSPSNRPSPREGSGIGYDPTSGVLVLFAGEDGGGELADTWTWDGSTWACMAGCP